MTSCTLFENNSSTSSSTSSTTTSTTTSSTNQNITSSSNEETPTPSSNPRIKEYSYVDDTNYNIVVAHSNFQLSSKPNEFTVYAVTDVHGKIDFQEDQYTGLAQLDYNIKHDANYSLKNSILISSGDMYQGYGISNYYEGIPMVDVFNMMGMVSNTIGNHEFDWGIDTLTSTAKYSLDNTGFVTLGSNIYNQKTNAKLDNVYDALIYDMNNFKVGIVGVIGQLENSISTKALGDYKFNTDVSNTTALGTTLKNTYNCDLVVLAAHESIDASFISTISNSTSSPFDIIFGGHSHAFNDTSTNKVPYLQAYCDSNGFSVANFTLNYSEYHMSESYNQYLTNPTQISDSLLDQDILNYIDAIDRSFLNRVLANITFDLKRYPRSDEDGNLIQFILKAMYNTYKDLHPEDTNNIITIHNNGGVRGDIYKGDVTVNDIFTVSPFDNRVVKIVKSGDKVYRQTVNNSSNSYYTNGVEVTNSSSTTWTVITIDYLTTNQSFPDLYDANNGGEDILPNGNSYYIRDLLINYIDNTLHNVIKLSDC